MRKRREPPCELTWRSVVLIEVPWGFAFFDVANHIFEMRVNMIWAHFTNPQAAHRAARLLDLIKVNDKSAVWCSNGPGESIAYCAKEYSSEAKRFIVEDEKLRCLIESNLEIDCFNEEEYVVHEVGWGLRNALSFLVSEFKHNITISRRCPLPLSHGFKDLMKKYEIVIPTKAVDRAFLTDAGTLQRLDELRVFCCTEMRKAYDKLVPGISRMIKDNSRYVEVMAKILTPWLVEEWDSSKWFTTAGEPWFTPDEMQKILAIDAAAGDARKKVEVDSELAAMIKDNLRDYRRFAKAEDIFLQKLRIHEAKAKRGQKRSHIEMVEQEVVEAAEGRKGEDGADATGGVSEEK